MHKCKALLLFLTSFLFGSQGYAHQVEIQGHRGTRGTLPENTLPAFAAAIDCKTDVLELDLHVTSDGVVLIHHDFFVRADLYQYKDGSTLSQKFLIKDLKLEEVKKLECTQLDPQFPEQILIPGTEIPTLQELFDLIRASDHENAKSIRLNLELKRDLRYPHYTLQPEEFAEKVLSLVEKNGFANRVYYSSFDVAILSALRKLDAVATLGLIYNNFLLAYWGGMDSMLQMADSLKIQILSPSHSLLRSKEDVLQLQDKGYRVNTWTINDLPRSKELMQMGVDGIITDYPAQLIQFIKEESL